MSYKAEIIMCGEPVDIQAETESEFDEAKRIAYERCMAEHGCKRCVIMDGTAACFEPNTKEEPAEQKGLITDPNWRPRIIRPEGQSYSRRQVAAAAREGVRVINNP